MPPSAAAPPAEAPGGGSAAPPPPPGGGGVRQVDLTEPGDGVLPSDAFRAEGFLASADPGTIAVPGCEAATAVAVFTDPDGKKFLTSSSPDDAAACHTVPVMIDFLREAPAGAVKLTPVTKDALEMEVGYADLSRSVEPSLSVGADKARARGGVDFVLVRPKAQDGAATTPVALTRMAITALR